MYRIKYIYACGGLLYTRWVADVENDHYQITGVPSRASCFELYTNAQNMMQTVLTDDDKLKDGCDVYLECFSDGGWVPASAHYAINDLIDM